MKGEDITKKSFSGPAMFAETGGYRKKDVRQLAKPPCNYNEMEIVRLARSCDVVKEPRGNTLQFLANTGCDAVLQEHCIFAVERLPCLFRKHEVESICFF
jgi:hypothetical protein